MLTKWIYLCAVSSVALAEVYEYHAHPVYSFEYGVNDPSTHDVKKHWETRNGDKVEGSYSVEEADGTVRIVDYHANDLTGFNAVVRREGHAVHPPAHHHEPAHPVHIPVVPSHTHTVVHTSVNHNPIEPIVHTPIYTSVQNPVHSYIAGHHPAEAVSHTRIHTTVENPSVTHTIETPHHTVSHKTPVYTTVHESRKTVIHPPIENAVHVNPDFKVVHETTKPIVKTLHEPREYTIRHNTGTTAIHTPIESAVHGTQQHAIIRDAGKTEGSSVLMYMVHVPVEIVPVHTETASHHISAKPTEGEPEVYKSQIG